MEKITAKEKKVARLLQGNIPMTIRPFGKPANACGLTEDKVLNIIKSLSQKGFIRKFGVILRHQKVGYKKNALIIWSVPQDKIEKAGEMLASFEFISHCYERKPAFQKKYNLFAMLHTRNEDISSLANRMAIAIGINDFLILESLKEYKKNSPEYF